MAKHSELKLAEVHSVVRWEVADTAERMALPQNPKTRGCVCYQFSDESYWLLTPSGWAPFSDAAMEAHLFDHSNPHHLTSEQVGADPAGSALVAQGAAEKASDPVGSAATVQEELEVHRKLTNPHGLTLGDLGGASREELEYEVTTLRAVLESHQNSLSNPHRVSAGQVGLGALTHHVQARDSLFTATGANFRTLQTPRTEPSEDWTAICAPGTPNPDAPTLAGACLVTGLLASVGATPGFQVTKISELVIGGAPPRVVVAPAGMNNEYQIELQINAAGVLEYRNSGTEPVSVLLQVLHAGS